MNELVLIEIDCLGDICPIPMMKLKKYEKALKEGKQIKVITDHSCVAENVKNYCKSLKYKLEVVEPINGVWEMYISK